MVESSRWGKRLDLSWMRITLSFQPSGTDPSRYNGSINYIPFNTTEEDYWRIPIQNVTVAGAQIDGVVRVYPCPPSSSPPSHLHRSTRRALTETRQTNQEAAIDTGTSLIGASAADLKKIYSQIPGSFSLIDTIEGGAGYYAYFCNATVDLQLGFGGQMYNISDDDFNLGPYDAQVPDYCVGALFELDT